jgi:hypothetical protein
MTTPDMHPVQFVRDTFYPRRVTTTIAHIMTVEMCHFTVNITERLINGVGNLSRELPIYISVSMVITM